MNWVDLAVLGVVAISAILAFMRGFVREVLGIAAWAAAGYIAVATNELVKPQFRQWIAAPEIADPVSYIAVFVVGLIVFSVVTNMVGKAVHSVGWVGWTGAWAFCSARRAGRCWWRRFMWCAGC